MKNIVVVGSQWGDEGKGKIVDWLSTGRRCNQISRWPQRRSYFSDKWNNI